LKAIWIRDSDRAFYYVVDFSAKLEVEMGFLSMFKC